MLEIILKEFQSPEFWVSVAFCGLVIFGMRPVARKIGDWSRGQAALVQKELDDAHNLRQEAETLYAEYEEHTKNLDKEHADIIRTAEQEVIEIQQTADERLSQKLAAKKKEVQSRIQSIEDNARRELAQAMMTTVMSQTKQLVSAQSIRQSEKDMDRALDQALSVLEKSDL